MIKGIEGKIFSCAAEVADHLKSEDGVVKVCLEPIHAVRVVSVMAKGQDEEEFDNGVAVHQQLKNEAAYVLPLG